MIVLFFTLLLFEILSFLTLRDHYSKRSRVIFYIVFTIHFALTILMWFYVIRVVIYKGFYDDPAYIRMQLILGGIFSAVFIPRFIICLVHYAGKLIKIKRGGHIGWLTEAGMIFGLLLAMIFVGGSFHGRNNIRTEETEVRIKGLDSSLDGLKIVHVSDMHLSSFYNKMELLEETMKKAHSYNPDLIINTGDFVTLGWREFDRCDTIFSKFKGVYGNFAVLGNHDMGTYLPRKAAEEKRAMPAKMSELINGSGYRLLNDENEILNINGVKVAITGVKTGGSYPGIVHGDLKKAALGTDSAHLKILLCHDPNQWELDVTGKTDIELTLAGHTHGMQMGILTKKFKWSPAKLFYPRWNGLYKEGNQYLYVNRGLGVLGVPYRIWMPPEITILTLKAV